MKIWLKLVIGIIFGALFTFITPNAWIVKNIWLFQKLWELTTFIDIPGLFINIGRYVIFPLVFFSLIQGTYELMHEKKLFEVYGQIFLYLIASTAMLVVIGVLSVFLFSPERIPIIPEEIESYHVLGFNETILISFPKNLFNALVGNGDFMLPIVILAVIFGTNLTFDKMITRPVVQVVDSLSRIFYHITSLLVELFWIAIIAITARTFFNFQMILENSIFRQLIIILGIDMLVVLFGIYPALLYLLGERKNPYKWLYAITAPLLTAFITGDEYISLGMLVKHGKENLGIPRNINSAVYPVFALFGRAGTALVTSVSFILIMKSYSSFEIDFLQILWVIGYAFLVSFALGSVPGMGAFVSISLLCTLYGKGLQDLYLILKPISALLVCFAVVMDVATSAFTSFLITHGKKVKHNISIQNFI